MVRIISIHEYDLKPDVTEEQFEQAIRNAEARGVLQLPGLVAYHVVKGVKGVRRGAYTIIWIYASQEAWEHLWGTPEQPRGPQDYPENWRVWEEEILASLLAQHPDAIRFTAYAERWSEAQWTRASPQQASL